MIQVLAQPQGSISPPVWCTSSAPIVLSDAAGFQALRNPVIDKGEVLIFQLSNTLQLCFEQDYVNFFTAWLLFLVWPVFA